MERSTSMDERRPMLLMDDAELRDEDPLLKEGRGGREIEGAEGNWSAASNDMSCGVSAAWLAASLLSLGDDDSGLPSSTRMMSAEVLLRMRRLPTCEAEAPRDIRRRRHLQRLPNRFVASRG